MQQVNTFASEQDRQKFVSLMQEYASNQIDIVSPKNLLTERKIALLSYIAVKPQYVDRELIDKLAGLQLEETYPNFNDILHEFISATYKTKPATATERFLCRGLESKQVLDVALSSAFRENCAKFNYTPKFIREENVVERAVSGLINIYSNGQLTQDLILDKQDFLDKLDEKDGKYSKLNFKLNLLLNNFKNSNKNDYAKALCALSVINFCLTDLSSKKLKQDEIIATHNYLNDFDIFIKNTVAGLLESERIKDVETLYDRKITFDNLIDKFNQNNAIDFSTVDRILQRAQIEKITSATGKMHKQLEVLEQANLPTNSAVNYAYLHILSNYSNYIFVQEFLISSLENAKSRDLTINDLVKKAHSTALEMQDREIVTALDCIEENNNIAKSSKFSSKFIFENYFADLENSLNTQHRSKLYYKINQYHARKTSTRRAMIAFLGLSEGIKVHEATIKKDASKTETESTEKALDDKKEQESKPVLPKMSKKYHLGLSGVDYLFSKSALRDYINKEKNKDSQNAKIDDLEKQENAEISANAENSNIQPANNEINQFTINGQDEPNANDIYDNQEQVTEQNYDFSNNAIQDNEFNQTQTGNENFSNYQQTRDIDGLKQIFSQSRNQAKQNLDNLQPIEDFNVNLDAPSVQDLYKEQEFAQDTQPNFEQNNDQYADYQYQNQDYQNYEQGYYQQNQSYDDYNQNADYSNTSGEYAQYPQYDDSQNYDQQYYDENGYYDYQNEQNPDFYANQNDFGVNQPNAQDFGQNQFDNYQNYDANYDYQNDYNQYGQQGGGYNSAENGQNTENQTNLNDTNKNNY